MRTRRVTIKDIAAEAGVSIALVSFVMNNKANGRDTYRVNKNTAQRILDVARRLDYQPNNAARTLRCGRTNTIGVIVSDISNKFFADIARCIEDRAYKYNYTVLFGSTDENAGKLHNLVEVFLNKGIDIDAPLYNGDTALQISIYIKKPQIAEFLIKKGARLDVISNGMTVTDLAVTTNQPEIITKIPPDKIVIGKKNRNNYVYFARVVKLYDTGKTDVRIIDALLKQGFISEKYLEEIRTILKKHNELYTLL